MRIFVVEPDGAGGMVHYAYQLCTALAAEGVDVTLVTGRHYELAHLPHSFDVDTRMALWPAVGEPAPGSGPRGMIVRLGRKLRRVWRGVRYAWVWQRLTTHLIRERPDVVQFAIIRFPFQAMFLRRLRRAGITLTQICHEFEPRERPGLVRRLTRGASRSIYDSFDRIYLHGAENRSRFLDHFDVDPARVGTIHHANEAMFLQVVGAGGSRRLAGVPSDRPVALFFGGLRPSKGIEDLISAWPMVVDEIDAHLHVCGQPAGVTPDVLAAAAAALGVASRVTIDAGYVPLDEVASVVGGSDLVVLPYRSATASGVLQLAYAFGRPVVATHLGALAEDVRDGDTGLLVPPADPAALARAIVKVLSDPAEASRMGEAARAEADRFGWDAVARTIAADARELTG